MFFTNWCKVVYMWCEFNPCKIKLIIMWFVVALCALYINIRRPVCHAAHCVTIQLLYGH